MARTAVVVGTANAVSNKQQQKYANQAEAQQAAAAPVEAAPAAAPADDLASQIEALGKLHAQGLLTDEEFSAKKAQILGL